MDVALVDLDFTDLDVFRARLGEWLAAHGEDPAQAVAARVRLVLAEGADTPGFAWAGLAGAPRAGELGRLSEVVVDAVVVSAHSARRDEALRLAASLGARGVVLTAARDARDARPHEARP